MPEPIENILVADDEPAVLEICLRILRHSGYGAMGVADGRRALESFAQGGYALVLTDIKMPDLDGMEVLQRVKELSPDTPVVLITGYGNLETAMQAVRYGAAGFVLKPFHARDLLHAVEEALAKTRLWRENVRLKTLVPLLEGSRALVAETDATRLKQLIVSLAAGLAHADMTFLFLRDGMGQVVEAARDCEVLSPLDGETMASVGRDLERVAADEPGLAQNLCSRLGLADLLLAPVSFRDAMEGYLIVGRSAGHGAFEEGMKEALVILTWHAAAALENAALFEQIRGYAEHLEEMVDERTHALAESEARVRQLYELSRQLHISLDLDQIMASLLGLAISAVGASYGSLAIPAGVGLSQHRMAQGSDGLREADAGLEGRLAQRVIEERRPLSLDDLAARTASHEGCLLGIPLLLDDQVEAVLMLWHDQPGALSQQHVNLLLPICSRAAALIANARTFRQTSERLDQAYQELQERARQLEMTTQQLVRSDRLAVIGQLAAGISHEMGNIIAPLQMYADLLAGAEPGDGDYQTFVGQIRRITERARAILRQFTDFSRKDKGTLVDVDVRDVINASLELMSFTLNRKGVAVRKEFPPTVPLVSIDPGQLEQVCVNIIVNAIDAMAGGGLLRIFVEARASAEAGGGPGYLEMRFQDTGIGIEPQHLGHVFEPFFSTKEMGKGTGLGLFICYGIIERHNGSIDVESEPGKGTTLIIRLPASRANG